MKDIVIIANFCGDFSEKDNGRFMYLCRALAKENRVEVVTSSFVHATKTQRATLTVRQPFKVTFLREPGYAKNISLQRFASHRAWGKEVGRYLKARKKPDVVYCAIPSLTGPLAAAKYCEQNGVRFIIDIQDLWPEAFQMVFNVPVLSRCLFWPFKRMADGIYSRADAICAVSRTYARRAEAVNKKADGTHVVFLGTRLDTFDRNAAAHPVEKPAHELWVGYCGALAASYDLTVVIDALSLIGGEGRQKARLIVMGDGERRAEFEDHARALGVSCTFTGYLPYDEMCGWLSACDIAVNPIRHNAAQSIINKHGDYASAGIPVVSTQESREYRDLVDEYGMGFNCSNSDPGDVADKLKKLIDDEGLRRRMGENARRCARERFDRETTYREIMGLF